MQGNDMRFVVIRIDDQLIRMAVDPDQSCDAHPQPGFLPDLPFTSLRHRFPRFHTPTRKAPLSVICAARKKDSSLLIEDGSGTTQAEFSLLANPFTIQNRCHFPSPFLRCSPLSRKTVCFSSPSAKSVKKFI